MTGQIQPPAREEDDTSTIHAEIGDQTVPDPVAATAVATPEAAAITGPVRPAMTLRNLTPHDVTLIGDDGVYQSFATEVPNGAEGPRVIETVVRARPAGAIDGVPVELRHIDRAEVTGLPTAEDGVLLIVSEMVREAEPDRSDLVSPTALVRDPSGRIIGARALRACATLVSGAADGD
jgi:hypothetical protein